MVLYFVVIDFVLTTYFPAAFLKPNGSLILLILECRLWHEPEAAFL